MEQANKHPPFKVICIKKDDWFDKLEKGNIYTIQPENCRSSYHIEINPGLIYEFEENLLTRIFTKI